jgi:hypothetical protein
VSDSRGFLGFLALLPSLLASAGACLVFWPPTHRGELVRSAIWGLTLLVSFVGWGSAVRRLLVDRGRLDWGLSAVVGMATLLALGGLLQVMRAMSPMMVVVLTSGGLAALAAVRFGRRQELVGDLRQALAEARRAPLVASAIGMLYLLALIVYAGNVATPVLGVFDDAEAYAVYPEGILAIGALEEPFSFRRLGALGGQSLLQAFLLVGSETSRLNGFDNGICLLAILGMVHGYAPSRRGATLVAMLFVVGFTYPFHNLGSAVSGTAFFFALFRVLDGTMDTDLTRTRGAILVGLVAAGAWTLRQNYMVAVLAILGANHGFRWFGAARERREVWSFVRALGALVLFLVPWWIVAHRSSSTFLFPLVIGNGSENFGVTERLSLGEELHFFVLNAVWNQPVRTIGLFVLAGVFLHEGPGNRTVRAFLVGTAVAGAALIHALSGNDDIQSLSRYYMGFEYAGVLGVTLKSLGRLGGAERPIRTRSLISAALVIGAVGIHLWDTGDEFEAHHFTSMARLTTQIGVPFFSAQDPAEDLYRRLQATVPQGETILEILDEPFRLDFRRNRILVCDQPGGAGPAPGWPLHQGVEAYERYFRSHGIRFLAFTLGRDSPEYDRTKWEILLRRPPFERDGQSRGTLLRDMAVFYLDVFDALEALAERKKHLFREGSIHVLDLDTPAPS